MRRKVSVILFDLEPLPECVHRLAVFVEMPLPSADELEKLIRGFSENPCSPEWAEPGLNRRPSDFQSKPTEPAKSFISKH